MNSIAIFFKYSLVFMLLCGSVPLFSGCAVPGTPEPADPYYMAGEPEHRGIFRDLFTLLQDETISGEEQFSVVQEIANEYARLKEYGRLINFLTSWSNKHPNDPYTAYYLFMTAYAYVQQDALPVAALYFDLIIKNYPDLLLRGESIHFLVLNQLITLVNNQEQLVWYYEELISRFPDKIDPGVTYFLLGQAYERIGEWNEAIQAYTQFLPYYGTVIPGFPDAYTYAKQIVDFNNSPKDWTFENINSLLSAIQAALDAGNSVRLWQYRAKVNFFARSWEQEDDDNAGMVEFNLSDFMRGNRIRYAPELDAGSNANEAYLRTWGWSQYISTWYLYFRKIYFPSDPEIHGRWEWAGVYYGEKF
ncbi:MAG: tetratricopeptide repeat protein [Spirochaetaceae bacterium]|jgi:tetratricopeptide (TPR) repeat protein|nr:tetratricopeptide repeat protein [Spirochaetaceae bacterium]